jgi:hypothetical protein
VAPLINYDTQFLFWGWRLSLGLAVVPGLMVILVALFVTETHDIESAGRVQVAQRIQYNEWMSMFSKDKLDQVVVLVKRLLKQKR